MGLGLSGTLSVEAVALALLALVGALAFGGPSRGGLVVNTVRVGVPLVSLVTFAAVSTGGQVTAVLGGLLSLFVVLLGFYIMLRGVFRGGALKDATGQPLCNAQRDPRERALSP